MRWMRKGMLVVAGVGICAVGAMAAGSGALVIAEPLDKDAWISQAVLEPRVERSDQVQIHAWAQHGTGEWGPQARCEIRTADEKERVVIIDQPWQTAADEAAPEDDFFLRGVTLPNGAYVMAWKLNGERRSNVVRFEVGPGPATMPKREDFLRIAQGEPRHAGELPMVELLAKRNTESDPDSVDLAWAGLFVDGQALTRKPTDQRGHGAPILKVGEQQKWRERWDVWTETVDGTVPHTIQAVYGQSKSAEVKLLLATPMGDAWDAATPQMEGNGTLPGGLVAGLVTDDRGARASGYRVELLGGGKVYEAVSGTIGRFLFAGVPAGDYELTCEPADKGALAVVEKVTVAGVPIARGITFEAKYGVSGKVLESTEDGGGPAVGRAVRATFVSVDGTATVDVSAETDATGAYVLKGPFDKVRYVGVISSPEPTPARNLVAPRDGVDFRLSGSKEEMRRVR